MYPHQWFLQKHKGLYNNIIDSLYQYYNDFFNYEVHSESSECYDMQATLTCQWDCGGTALCGRSKRSLPSKGLS